MSATISATVCPDLATGSIEYSASRPRYVATIFFRLCSLTYWISRCPPGRRWLEPFETAAGSLSTWGNGYLFGLMKTVMECDAGRWTGWCCSGVLEHLVVQSRRRQHPAPAPLPSRVMSETLPSDAIFCVRLDDQVSGVGGGTSSWAERTWKWCGRSHTVPQRGRPLAVEQHAAFAGEPGRPACAERTQQAQNDKEGALLFARIDDGWL